MDVEIDIDCDGKLLDQFRSLGTTDRDVLIAEFQAVLGKGNNTSPELCAFFLDMNNWNLHNAVCSYYDFEQPADPLPSMAVLADVTVGDGESVATNTTFYKSWRIKNTGVDRWPPGCHLCICTGHNLATVERKIVEPLSPGETMDVHLEMRSPSQVGTYNSIWRMRTPTGTYFGEMINVDVVVADGGLLGITQQMSRIGGELVNQAAVPNSVVNISINGQSVLITSGDTSMHQQNMHQQNIPDNIDSTLMQGDSCNTSLPSITEDDDDAMS